MVCILLLPVLRTSGNYAALVTMAYALQRPPYHTVTDKAAWHTTRLV